MRGPVSVWPIAAGFFVLSASTAWAQQSADDLAKATANPLASMISVPFQYNFDYGAGPTASGKNSSLKAQPVVPFRLNDDWNVISRTIIPLTFAQDIFPKDTFGLGDTTESLWLSPVDSGVDGLTWGLGPVFLLPTATDPVLGTGKFAIGPTGLIVLQQDKVTVGALVNQLWSVAGDPNKPDVNQLFVQPFFSYALPEGQSIGVNLEATYDWTSAQWTVPLNVSYSKVFTLGTQPMSGTIGLRKYLAAPAGGPDWGVRAGLTFLFPQAH